MDPRDDEIEFDFFDEEPATTEAPGVTRTRMIRRGGRGPGARRPTAPPRGFTPLVRLLALIAVLVGLLVVFGVAIQSCTSGSRHDSYKHYFDKVRVIASSSTHDGTSMANALVTPGAKVPDLVQKLNAIAETERQNVDAASRLDPPGRLRPVSGNLVEALQLRVSGTQGLAAALQATANSKNANDVQKLTPFAEQLIASDVVYDDLYMGPASAQVRQDNVRGVIVPSSTFVSNHELLSRSSMSELLRRLRTTTSGGTPTGLHGTNIVDVRALPSGHILSPSQLNTVTASTSLGFEVRALDSGDSQEVGIKVTLTIQQNPAIVKTKTIQVINPGQTIAVKFTDLGEPQFARRVQLNVDVAPVAGEHNTANNKGTYPVIFSLG